jgi:transposase
MTQGITGRYWRAEARTQETKQLIRDIKHITRRKCTAEEKIRDVLEGFRRDTPIRYLYRREGICPSMYYAWLKDFMEARKERLTRDMTRDATRIEIQEMKRENARLKTLVVELSLQVHVLKKQQRRIWNKGKVREGECCRQEGDNYFNQCYGKFDLFDKEHPFYQFADLDKEVRKLTPLKRLAFEYAIQNNSMVAPQGTFSLRGVTGTDYASYRVPKLDLVGIL